MSTEIRTIPEVQNNLLAKIAEYFSKLKKPLAEQSSSDLAFQGVLTDTG